MDDVRNLLFGPMGFDLAALNMQRGRDHGLPSYNQMRATMGLTPYMSWDDAVFMDGVKDLLMSVYTDINDIDLWIGGLAENHVNGGMLGELFSAIVGDQFSRLRDGDRFWYQNGMFETEWMEFIEGSTLSAIIMRNTGITGLQANVFSYPSQLSCCCFQSGLPAWVCGASLPGDARAKRRLIHPCLVRASPLAWPPYGCDIEAHAGEHREAGEVEDHPG